MNTPSKKTNGPAKEWFKRNYTDIAMVVGVVSVFYGLFRMYSPAAFIALGGGIIYWAIQTERKQG